MAKDFYDILGVKRDATDEQVRSAYRAQARKCHPDVNKAPDAAERFSTLQKAYEVLSDREKRTVYDRFGEAGLEAGVNQAASASAARSGARRGPGINIDGMNFDPDDLSSIFETIFSGEGTPPGAGPWNAGAKRKGGRAAPPPVELVEDIDVDFMTAAKGGKKSLRISAGTKSKEIEVTIPVGVENGAVLRMQGPLGPSGEPAQILLTVHVGRHPVFQRGGPDGHGRGLDLTIEVPVTLAESTLGATLSLPTLTGNAEIRIPPDSPSGRRLRLKGQGIRDAEGRVGDLYALVRVIPPASESLTEQEKEFLRQVSAKTPGVRTGPEWNTPR
ncbi:MAG: DnaJ C-terminal domain-containing protein [Phycisphaerales bacterium]